MVLDLEVGTETLPVTTTKIIPLDAAKHRGYDITCEQCGTQARKQVLHAKFCSASCRMQSHKEARAKEKKA